MCAAPHLLQVHHVPSTRAGLENVDNSEQVLYVPVSQTVLADIEPDYHRILATGFPVDRFENVASLQSLILLFYQGNAHDGERHACGGLGAQQACWRSVLV